jgi:uncharacterized damage-inducible protein DinB
MRLEPVASGSRDRWTKSSGGCGRRADRTANRPGQGILTGRPGPLAREEDGALADPLIENFQTLARYNTLANHRLYGVCALLPDAERKKRRLAFFGSIHGTLNHIMVGDRIWLARFSGEEVPSTGLDAVLYEDFERLWRAREAEDARIEAFASGLDEEFLEQNTRYVNNEGKVYNDPIALLVAHFFNHQTHHRGQIHDMLTQAEVVPPVLDLHRVIRP